MDFGGRQIQVDAQHEGKVKTFVYYYLDDRFTQWDSQEVCDSLPLDGNFQSLLKKLYSTFDNHVTIEPVKFNTAAINLREDI